VRDKEAMAGLMAHNKALRLEKERCQDQVLPRSHSGDAEPAVDLAESSPIAALGSDDEEFMDAEDDGAEDQGSRAAAESIAIADKSAEAVSYSAELGAVSEESENDDYFVESLLTKELVEIESIPTAEVAIETTPSESTILANENSDGKDSNSDDEDASTAEIQARSGDGSTADGSIDTADSKSDGEGAYWATMMESQLAETNRVAEDAAAAGYVAAFVASAQASAEGPRIEGTFDPARDGDCLVRCAVEHDFGPAKEEGGKAAAVSVNASGGGAGEDWSTVKRKPKRAQPVSAAVEAPTAAPPAAPSVLTADELRLLVVTRVRANRLSALAAEVARVEAELREVEAKGAAAAAATEKVGEDDDGADEREAREAAADDLRGELTWLQGDAHDEVRGN
jgi:uncharacterized small protein (DUF1192 family)